MYAVTFMYSEYNRLAELDRLEKTELPRAKKWYSSRLADFNNSALMTAFKLEGGAEVLREEKNAAKTALETVEKDIKKLKSQIKESDKNSKLKGGMTLEQYR
jgi:hypothetical protein